MLAVLRTWSRTRRRRWFGSSRLVSGFAVALTLTACPRESREPVRTCASCRPPFTTDTAAAEQVRETWRFARALVTAPARELDLSCLCFGEGTSTLMEGENIYLPATWKSGEQAARAAHLALHRVEPPWRDEPERSCDERVATALRAEADGHALELETRRALRVEPARYPFEADYFATPTAERLRFLAEYFRTHPNGDGVVPGFAVQYRARCTAP